MQSLDWNDLRYVGLRLTSQGRNSIGGADSQLHSLS